jgi:3-oxoacyl-(acyl-carrier-protein) synthase
MKRVVVTGLGVVAANGVGLAAFRSALRQGISGLRFDPRLRDLNFTCQVMGVPEVSDEMAARVLTPEQMRATNSGMRYAALAAAECWTDAGFDWSPGRQAPADWGTAVCFGTGIAGMDTIAERVVPLTAAGQVRRLGSSAAEQVMSSNASALVGGMLGAGGQVSTNSSACATGTEAIVNAFRQVRHGYAERVVAGAAEGHSIYIAACFDCMRVTARGFNDTPERASRPLSETASGFVPGCGAGALLLESLESAERRGARIYAEILGGSVTCGGQRGGGTMTASNPEGVQRAVRCAVEQSGLRPEQIDYINGHLTATGNDSREIANLCSALEFEPERFPYVNSTKSLIGHALGASGAIECVATLLQLDGGFLHPSANCEDLHPGVAAIADRVVRSPIDARPRTALKTSFGFGDVNACVVFGKYHN